MSPGLQPSEGTAARAPAVPPHWLIRVGAFVVLFVIATVALLGAVASLGPLAAQAVAALAAAVLVGGGLIRWLDGRPVAALGFPLGRRAPLEVGAGFAIGGLILALAVLPTWLSGGVRWHSAPGDPGAWLATLAAGAGLFAVAAAAEEAVCRGYPFQVLVQALGVWPAAVASSAIFSLLHAGNANVGALPFVNLFLAGVMLALAYLRTRSLWFATGVHAGWNWAQASVLDLPVSGHRPTDTPLYEAAELGADWWTGGAFGPEGGVAASVALVAAIAWLWRTRRLRPSDDTRAAAPLVDARLAPLGR